MRRRRGLFLAPPFEALEYRSVSHTAIALISRWGLIDFVRTRRVPGRARALRLVGR